ncbi:MAG: hypothetical protein LBC41_05725 [Clostridiales bacterium]|nr:hypothetical protein [Clostridiales bacterium]
MDNPDSADKHGLIVLNKETCISLRELDDFEKIGRILCGLIDVKVENKTPKFDDKSEYVIFQFVLRQVEQATQSSKVKAEQEFKGMSLSAYPKFRNGTEKILANASTPDFFGASDIILGYALKKEDGFPSWIEAVEAYNSICGVLKEFPKYESTPSESKIKDIEAILSKYGIEEVKKTLKRATESSFLRGQVTSVDHNEPFKPNFFWIFTPSHFADIVAGKYDNWSGTDAFQRGLDAQ